MEEQKSVSRSVLATTISALAVVATLAGGGIAWLMTQPQPQATIPNTIKSPEISTIKPPVVNSPQVVAPITTIPKPPSPIAPTTIPSPAPTIAQNPSSVAPATDGKVKIFWLDDRDGKKVKIAPQERIARSTPQNPDNLVKESLTVLLASAGKEGKQTSTIPAGTRLLSSELKEDGLHINLSKEFIAGGGSTSMQGRIAQILYTATSRNPDTPVWIKIDGQQLEVLGGEGVEIKQPLTRKSFQQEFKDSIGE